MAKKSAAAALPKLREHYEKTVRPAMVKGFGYRNAMEAPRVTKVVVNVGVGEAIDNARALDAAVEDITKITGQRPVVTRARKSIANFKLREGRQIGVKVTLRGVRMWAFLDRRGNYTLGIRKQILFPEIQYEKVDKVRGMEISVVTTAHNDEEGHELLRQIGRASC